MKFRTDKDQFILDRCRGKRVLDVGCVNHTLEAALRPDWRHAQLSKVATSVVGLDYEKEAVRELCARGWNIIAADAQNFDIRDKYPEGFDVVVASELIEHLPNPGSFLSCAKNHLAPGGVILVTTPHAYGFAFFLEILIWGEERINDDHTMTFSRKNLLQLLHRCGLKELEFHWLIQDSTAMHQGWATRCAAKIFFLLQVGASSIRAGFSKEVILLAGAA